MQCRFDVTGDVTVATHPTAAALLRAVLLSPADDALRLVYADWLEEHGQADHSEFIRVQVELARTHLDVASLRLRDRESHLLTLLGRRLTAELLDAEPSACYWPNRKGPNWTGALLAFAPGTSGIRLHWQRGFVAEVRCNWQAWQMCGCSIVAAQPVVKMSLDDGGEAEVYTWGLHDGWALSSVMPWTRMSYRRLFSTAVEARRHSGVLALRWARELIE